MAETGDTDPRPTAAAAEITDEVLRELAGYNISRAMQALQGDLTRRLAPFGLRVLTFSALTLVCENPGLSQARLASTLRMKRSNLVPILDELETAGLVTRRSAPGDRRTHALYATEEGRDRCAAALLAVREHEARILARLSPSETSRMIAALRRVEAAALEMRQNGDDR